MYAFQAWNWELDVSYVVSLVEGLAEQVKLELKGLELMRLLPYNSLKGVVNWLSDRTRFSIDGFYLNRINKFYVKKNLIFLPLLNLFLCKNFELYKKYFEYFWLKNLFKIFNVFKNSKDFFFENYTYIYISLNLFFCIFFDYKNTKKYFKFFINFWNPKFKNFFFKKSDLKKKNQILKISDLSLTKSLIINFFFKFKKKYLLNKLTSLGLKYQKFQPILSIKLYNNVLLPLINKSFVKNINVFFNLTSDINFFSLMVFYLYKFKGYNNLNLLSNSITIKKMNIKNFLRYFNFFDKREFFWEPDLIFLIGLNLRLYAPKIHLYLRKLSKNWIINFVSFLCNDFFLFFHFNFGHNKKIFEFFLKGQNWSNSFLKKSKKIVYIFSGFLLNNNFLLEIFKFFKTNNFFFKNIFFSKKEIVNYSKNFFKKKNYFYTNYINFLLLFNSPINYIYNFFLEKKMFLKKVNSLTNKYKKSNLNIFFDYWNFFKMLKFNKTKFDLKNSFNILIETNLNEFYLNKYIDFIFPGTLYIENFSFFKNYTGNLQKSLFIKFGPWLSWTIFNICFFIFTSIFYPFFWLFKLSKQLYLLMYLNIEMWIQGFQKKKSDKNIIFEIKKLKKKNSYPFFFWKHLLFFRNFYNYDVFFWHLSFFQSSKYISMSYDITNINPTFSFIS